MKIIVLAAGCGTRLAPYTDSKPKCMVEVSGKSILDYQLELFEKENVAEIIIVSGYRNEKICRDSIVKVVNPKFASTNMVYSLFCAREHFDDDVIISYGDIIYSRSVLKKIMAAEGEFSVVVDKDWYDLWALRMENPLDDVESLRTEGDRIIELGKKVNSLDAVQGQYIGLMKIRRDFLQTMQKFYLSLSRTAQYDGKNYENMYLTSFIQLLINRFGNVSPVYINGDWVEVDTASDLEIYTKNNFFKKRIGRVAPDESV
jgi:L-glutamine-phosphate cytidylyltransferase